MKANKIMRLPSKALLSFSTLLLLMILFQNCSKNQALHLESTGVTINNDSTIGDITPPDNGTQLPPLVDYKSCMINGVERPHLWTSWGLKNLPPAPGSNNETCDLFELHQCIDGVINPLSVADSSKSSCDTLPLPAGTETNPCVVDGHSIPHGQVSLLFKNAIASDGKNCLAQIRRCVNGALTGDNDYTLFSCGESHYKPSSGQYYDCEVNDTKIPDGAAMVFFREEKPGGSCDMQARRCVQGRLSGRYLNTSCQPQ